MGSRLQNALAGLTRRARGGRLATGLLVLLPGIGYGVYQIWGEIGLAVVAVGAPIGYILVGLFPKEVGSTTRPLRGGPLPRSLMEAKLDAMLRQSAGTGRSTACLVLEVDSFARVEAQLGRRGADLVTSRLSARLADCLRDDDLVGRFDGARYAVAVAPAHRVDLESMLQLSARLQDAVSTPLALDGSTLHLTASIGFCRPDAVPLVDGPVLVDAAEAALDEAVPHGPGGIRAYSVEMHRHRARHRTLITELERGVEEGQVCPWFQPQVCTDTGLVMGFEALARWIHPARGQILPGEFLDAAEAAGLMERIGEVVLEQSLSAITAWDRAGFLVPGVGVNFSEGQLSAPALADKIAWHLDRHGLEPRRLCVEILENVIARDPEDVVTKNITALSRMGCKIDLDDFGTGHASISSLRRFAVDRIKIDRSFVTRVDSDPEQRQMIAAILVMAERLSLSTVAEGVETAAEHALLAQLGCTCVQGFGIGRPMPMEDTFAWLRTQSEKISDLPSVTARRG